MNSYILIFVFFTIVYLYTLSTTETSIENYSENAGAYCDTCSTKTLGQCLRCYNCVVCDNKCVKGNVIDAQSKNKKCSIIEPNDIYWRNLNINYPDTMHL